MRNVNLPRIVIFALNDGDTDHELEILRLSGLSFIQTVGCYLNMEENSYCVVAESDEALAQVVELASWHDQEFILVSRSDRSSYLLYLEDGNEVEIGQLTGVTKQEAEIYGNYTLNPATGDYYVCQ